MRVVVVTHAGGSPHHGPNSRWYYLGKALSRHGVTIDIVSSSNFHKYLSPPSTSLPIESQDVDGITYHWVRTKPYVTRSIAQLRNQGEFVYGCYRSARRLSHLQPQIVLASSPHPFVVFPAYRIARLAGAKFIFEVRDLWPEILIELGGFSRHHPYMAALKFSEKYGVKHADKVMSVKCGDQEYFSKQYEMPRAKFAYVPNGFLPEKADSAPPERIVDLRKQYDFLIMYVGAISEYYQLESLIRLSSLLAEETRVGIAVVGRGDREQHIRDRQVAIRATNLHLVGAVAKQQVLPVLSLSDACYVGLADLDIHKFGISCNKIFEYMYAAKPILGSFNANYDPVSAADCGVVVPPGNEELLAKAVLQWLQDPEQAARLGLNGRRYFDAHHDFRVVAGQLYNEVLLPLTQRS